MLNDLERRRLADIEAALRDDDPALARRLSAGSAPHPRSRAVIGFGFGVALVVSVWLGVLVRGTAAGIAAGLVVCAVATGLLLQRRGRARVRPRFPRDRA